jgi:hypothetical protein
MIPTREHGASVSKVSANDMVRFILKALLGAYDFFARIQDS